MDMSKYVNINVDVDFNKEGTQAMSNLSFVLHLKQACNYLEIMLNSQVFKDFIMKKEYTNSMGLTKEEIYEMFTNKDIHLNFKVLDEPDNITVGYSISQEPPYIIKLRPWDINWEINNMATKILHEYSHTLGFTHSSAPTGTLADEILFTCKDMFAEYHSKVYELTLLAPQKNKWLKTYKPCWGLGFIRKVKLEDYK